jgi:hypothetical protein
MSKQEQDFRVWLDEQMDPDFTKTDLWPRLVRFVAEWLEAAERCYGERGVWPGGFGGTGSLTRSWREEMGGE